MNPIRFVVLNQQWNEFIVRLEKLSYLSSQYEKISLHQIDSTRSLEKPIEHTPVEHMKKPEQRMTVGYEEKDDTELFLKSVQEWTKNVFENL
ncbi:unnamed protein product [Adineta ricciae]|uniref:Uncharacterized protein n=1 Tax=Adineta ricciae TaxID=249248 RepID=A0A815S2Y7_ADIRI|nr:unnamed protein product [Adineta ricciae]CAF1486671.1 unnamed protein product [Adineta ricciae]